MSHSPSPEHKIYLGFDIGLKRTGVAVGQSLNKKARAAGLIQGSDGQMDWSHLKKLVEEWRPDAIIIGDPATNDPHLNKLINRFKSNIQQNHKIPIFDFSEELTSACANAELRDSDLSTRNKIEMRDQVAACLILEAYFNSV